MSKALTAAALWMAAALTLLAFAVARADFAPRAVAPAVPGPSFATPFQAVLLDNGQVYYGKISRLGTPFPKLVDVYNVVNTVNPKTKATQTVLVRWGREPDGPSETFLDARHIIMIEDVGAHSRIASLIAHSRAGGAAAAR
jgi:hypothetical protein